MNESFYHTIINSPEWASWEKEVHRRMEWHSQHKSKKYTGCWDIDESRECDLISAEHFADFIKFIKGGVKFVGKIK